MKRDLILACAIVFGLIGVVLLILHRLGGPFFYSADDISGWIVDEATGKPVQGALVVAKWELETFGTPVGILHSGEALTDANGMYRIRGFDRKLRPPLQSFQTSDPMLIVFKAGYWLEGRSNNEAYVRPYTRVGSRLKNRRLPDGRILQVEPGYSKESRRFCYWNGKTIPLDTRADTYEEQVRVLSDFNTALPDDFMSRFPLSRRVLATRPDAPRAPTASPMTDEELLRSDGNPANDPPPQPPPTE